MVVSRLIRAVTIFLFAGLVFTALPGQVPAQTKPPEDALPKWKEAITWFSATIKAERPEQALPYGLEAKRFSEAIFGSDNMVTAAVYYNLANTQAALGRDAEAETHYRLAVTIYERYEEIGGHKQPWTVMDLETLKFIVTMSKMAARQHPEGEGRFWRTLQLTGPDPGVVKVGKLQMSGMGPIVFNPRLKVLKDYAAFLRKIGSDAEADALGSRP